ncbi:type IV pilus modification protein PilV [Frateuria defendens]|uniref:type IV pilus modification protein PilV n=1 Tax=Frateuria defendens TaxID=2219559 RepID=UPI00066FF35A|nr:type IV pilus modification protein PilV [Frateuria defendens]
MKRQRGLLLLEVLVSMLIAAIALLGTATMMVKSSRGEMESYQRVQALTLVQDMVSRINANRQVASCYSSGATGVDTSKTLPTCATGTAVQIATANQDLTAWKSALLGSGETAGGASVGAMINAIGCVEQIDAVDQIYRVTVVWQGLMPTVAPSLGCGKDKYGTENLRRAVSVAIRIGNLST